ncbi:hypothetical protein LCGC14_3021640 [marine sediment metagenome]|uniref:Uncharacterized protein n=1 Tax=marine sediment metagenome TaxID=412755 RepID=A0A0F8Z2M8_9ZZZZ
MIILPPYDYERQLYHKMPVKDRWIMNKLHVAETMGYNCGPSGTFPKHGTYCLRPTHNPRGMYNGSFYKVNYVGEGDDLIKPGYFWCEWFEGESTWSEYINDRFSFGIGGTTDENGVLITTSGIEATPMPAQFKDISRYMLIERIGGKIVEVAPRLMASAARQSVIDNYRRDVDPSYDPQDVSQEWLSPSPSQLYSLPDGGFVWEEVPHE